MLTSKEFFDEDFYKKCLQDFESIRQQRNSFRGRPDPYDRLSIVLDRMFLSYYKNIGITS